MSARRTVPPNRAPWRWAVAGVVLGLLAGVPAFAPAQWLAQGIGQASAGQVVLQDSRGSLWSGSARLTLSGGPGSPAAATLPGRLNWQLRPTLGGVELQLQSDCCLQKAWVWRLSPHWGGWQLQLSDSQSRWPAGLLVGLGTPWNTLEPQGQLALNTRALDLRWSEGRLQLSGSAQLDVQDLSSRLSTLRPLGSYRLAVRGEATPRLLLSTLKGSLKLSGEGQWVGNRLRFVGEAGAAPADLSALSNLLNIIGRREGARSIIKVG